MRSKEISRAQQVIRFTDFVQNVVDFLYDVLEMDPVETQVRVLIRTVAANTTGEAREHLFDA